MDIPLYLSLTVGWKWFIFWFLVLLRKHVLTKQYKVKMKTVTVQYDWLSLWTACFGTSLYHVFSNNKQNNMLSCQLLQCWRTVFAAWTETDNNWWQRQCRHDNVTTLWGGGVKWKSILCHHNIWSIHGSILMVWGLPEQFLVSTIHVNI